MRKEFCPKSNGVKWVSYTTLSSNLTLSFGKPSREYIPSEILLSFELPEHDRELLSDYLTERAGHRVYVRTPKKGASKYLCDMAVTDAAKHSENTGVKRVCKYKA